MTRKNEQILCLTAKAVDREIQEKHGLTEINQLIDTTFGMDDVVIMSRDILEDDPNFKQLIPYALVINEKKQVLAYTRSKKLGESRLATNFSIGFGGHISVNDIAVNEGSSHISLEWTVFKSCMRELREELRFVNSHDLYDIGLYIREESNPVGEVHLGVVNIFLLLGEADPVANEKQIELLGWKDFDWLTKNKPFFEKWSQLLIDHIAEIVV